MKTADEYINMGIEKLKLEDNHGAIQYYTKAIEINPYFAIAYFYRGNSKLSLGDKNGACLDWSKAWELGLDSAYDKIKEYCN